MGRIVSVIHCMSLLFWELLRPLARGFRNNSFSESVLQKSYEAVKQHNCIESGIREVLHGSHIAWQEQ